MKHSWAIVALLAGVLVVAVYLLRNMGKSSVNLNYAPGSAGPGGRNLTNAPVTGTVGFGSSISSLVSSISKAIGGSQTGIGGQQTSPGSGNPGIPNWGTAGSTGLTYQCSDGINIVSDPSQCPNGGADAIPLYQS